MQADRFNNERYVGWIKTSLSLVYLKEGITGFSNEKAGELHKDVKQRVRLKSTTAATANCSKCTSKGAFKSKTHDKNKSTWTMNCPVNICNVWLEEILTYHKHSPLPNIAWANSNPRLWPSDVWEVAKLFQPYGCEKHTKAEDSDCMALLTMMLDCTSFHKYLSNTSILQEIKDIRNACMHSADQEIDVQTMTNALKSMIALLEEPGLKNRQECIKAKVKIEELRDNALELYLSKELELLALNNKVAEVRIDMDRLAAEHQEMKTNIGDIKDITTRQDTTMEQLRDQMAEVEKSMTKEEGKGTEEDTVHRIQDILVKFYEKYCQQVPIYPLIPKRTRRIEELYVKPKMVLEDPRGQHSISDTTNRGSTLDELTGRSLDAYLSCKKQTDPLDKIRKKFGLSVKEQSTRIMEEQDTKPKKQVIPIDTLRDIFYSEGKLY